MDGTIKMNLQTVAGLTFSEARAERARPKSHPLGRWLDHSWGCHLRQAQRVRHPGVAFTDQLYAPCDCGLTAALDAADGAL